MIQELTVKTGRIFLKGGKIKIAGRSADGANGDSNSA